MYEWTEAYEDEYLKEKIEQVIQAQKEALAQGRVLLSTYEQLLAACPERSAGCGIPGAGTLPRALRHVRARTQFPLPRRAVVYAEPWKRDACLLEKPAGMAPGQLRWWTCTGAW